MLFYDGPSGLDGARILGILTGLHRDTPSATQNGKVGANVVTAWIVRADREPHHAVRTGADASVCGDCPFRPSLASPSGRMRCYVVDSKSWPGLINIHRSWQMGNIPVVAPERAASLLQGRIVRLGGYGDPAAIPIAIWEALLADAAVVLGYTHQYRTCDPRFARWLMASVETGEGRHEARALGYRTYRVDLEEAGKLAGEARCPASKEMGHRLTCATCQACNGTATGRRADIVIRAH